MESSVQHEHVISILLDALQLPPEEREAHLRAQCNGDEELHREVVEGLQLEEQMGNFLLEPLFDFAALARPFEPGQVVDRRFAIVREIGEGGMGVVYEADDQTRHKRIAIKAAKPGFQRLLSPELEGALKVRHHNICLVNQIHTAQTEYGETDFLTMELLQGQTLSAYLAGHGKLNHKEALDIACQLCAGLGEAHLSGILHRDLKSANVILCQNEDGSCRAVITDFGLASGVTMPSGEMGGTPAYMAPELLRGEQASTASDIYALGVILYEMIAGRRPYDRDSEEEPPEIGLLLGPAVRTDEANPQDWAGRNGRPPRNTWISEELWHEQAADPPPPPPPSTWTKGLDPRWNRVIMGCLAVSPAERTQDVSQVLEELQRKRLPKWPFVATGLLLAVLAAAVGLIRPLRQWVIDSIWPPNVRLAVLPYDGPQDLAAIAGGALQEVAERVQQLPSERRWPLNKLSRSVAVIPPSRITYVHAETPQQARDILRATHALKVSLGPDGDKFSVHASVIDLVSQLPVQELSVEYPQKDISTMSAGLTHFVAMTFRLREPPEAALAPGAAEAYLKGLYFLNRDIHSFDEAMEQFQEAARRDPNSALPPAGMALALVQKYNETTKKIYLEQAREFVRTAQSRNPDSVRVLLASGRVNEATNQFLRAVADYRRIQELQPRNVDALLRMGFVYEQLDEPDEVLAALRKAQELDPAYYKPYQAMGEFYSHRGRYSEAAEQFSQVVARAPGFFDGYSSLGAVLIELGRFDEAEDALKHSLTIRETAMALNNLGAMRAFQGRYEEAAAYQKRALAYRPNDYIWLLNIADNTRWAGHPSEAMPYYRKARELARADMTSNPQSATARGYFAYFSARLGNRVRADEEIKQAMNLAPGDNDVLWCAVRTYEALGERDLAIEALRGITLAQLRRLTREPDLADFCQDPRFKQQMIDKGGQ